MTIALKKMDNEKRKNEDKEDDKKGYNLELTMIYIKCQCTYRSSNHVLLMKSKSDCLNI